MDQTWYVISETHLMGSENALLIEPGISEVHERVYELKEAIIDNEAAAHNMLQNLPD